MRLIADSGGTKTDWCFVDSSNNKKFFTTESYHPSNWNEAFWARFNNFWKKQSNYFNCDLEFYGAGLLNEARADELQTFFQEVGFSEVIVKSDLFAAGRALNVSELSTVAILGTGSVLFKFDGENIHGIIGGKGHEIGDEGSGYYFGKLVYEAYERELLTESQLELFINKIDILVLERSLKTKESKYELSNVAYLLRDNRTEFYHFHKQNCCAFYYMHSSGIQNNKISFVGSYAFHFQGIIRQVLSGFGVEVEKVIEKPIRLLID